MTGQVPRDFGEWMQKVERQSKNAVRIASRARYDARETAHEVVEGALPGTPAAPVEISAGGSIYKDASGAWRGRIDVDFPDVVFTTDGKPVTVSGYEMHGYEEALYPKGTEPVWQQYGGSDTSTITRIDLPQGVWYVMKVRAVGGEWSSTFRVQTTHDTTAPPQPTKPTASVFLGAVTVKWDKKAVTGDMPADFEAAILCVGTEPSPGLDKAVTRFDLHESIFVITGASYYAPVYIRLIAVDQSGNLSPWSEQVTAMTKPLVDADIILGELDAAKTRIVNAGKIMLKEGLELSQKLQEADTAISEAREALEGPGGLTERLEGAEQKLDDVGELSLADGTTLNKKLADNEAAITDTRTSLTGPGGLADRLKDTETLLGDVGSLTLEAGMTLRSKLQASDLAIKNTGTDLATLRETTLPALNTSLQNAATRLDAADKLLTDTFPKRLATIEGTASTAASRATAAETAAAKAAADLATAKQRADTAASAAAQAALDAAAAEASSERATGAAGVAEAAADASARQATAALAAAQNAGGDVGAAQAAAKAAQAAADAAKAQATTAGTAAAAADAKAAQAAANAAKAAADALLAQQQATKSAGEATTAKSEAAAAATKAAAAEAAAATAKTRADAAASDATAAAAKAVAAESSATKASGAAGVAETAADKAAKDATAALTQAQNSGTNATAAQRAADAAKTASDTATAKAAAAGTSAAAADAAAAKAAANAAQAAADLIVAKNAAADARGDADTALERADAAVTAAGSAARVLYSTGDPSGTAREGDTWRKTNGTAGDVIAEWRYSKVGTAAASWKPQKVTSEMVSNLDVGKLTVGTAAIVTLVAERIAGATAEFQRVDAKNIFVTGTASLEEVVAKRIASDTGKFLTLGVEQLTVTGTANLKEAVANKLFANIFIANKISTQHMLIGNFSNLLENGSFEYGNQGWSGAANYTFEQAGGKQVPGVLKFTGTTERSFGPMSGISMPVDAGDTYRLAGWAKTTAAAGAVAEICWYWYAADGTFLGNNNLALRDMKATDGWLYVSGQKAPPENAAHLRIRVVSTLPKATDQLFFDDISVALAADASLIVDGAVTAKSIKASEEMSAKIGQFLTLGVEQLTVTGTANMATAVADRMFTNLFSTRKLTANQIYVGEGGNLFPADMMDSGWDTSADLINQYADGGRDGGSSMVIEASANQVGTYFALSVKDRARAPRLLPGQKYRISAFVRGNAAVPVNGVRLYVRLFKLNSTSTSGYTWASPSSVANEVAIPANTWDKVEAFFTVPEGTDVVAVVGIYSEKGTNTNVRFSDIVIQEAITPELIVNGAIIAKHITASEEMGAKLGRFIKLEVTDLVSTGSTKINDAVITKLFTETFATNKLTAGQVLIGMPGNILPDIGHNEPAMLAARNAASTMSVTLSSTKDYALAPHATNTTYFRPLGVAQTAAAAKDWVPVQPGQIWRWGLTVTSMRTAGSIGFVGRTLDGAAYATTPVPRTVVNVGNGSYVYESKIPENCAWICPEFILPPGTAATWVEQGSMFMYQVIDNALIVDGAITTKKLTVTAEMTAELLKAKKVEAIEIDANSIRADVGFIGILRTGILSADVVTSLHIKSDSITTELLKSDAITSKHTLTGPLIRTAVSGARTEMTNQGIRVLDASNMEWVKMGYGIGTGMSIRNPASGTLTPLSSIIFGATTLTYAETTVAEDKHVLLSTGRYTAVSKDIVVVGSASGWINTKFEDPESIVPGRANVQVTFRRVDGEYTPTSAFGKDGHMLVDTSSLGSLGSNTTVTWQQYVTNLVVGVAYIVEVKVAYLVPPKALGVTYDREGDVVTHVTTNFIERTTLTVNPQVTIIPR